MKLTFFLLTAAFLNVNAKSVAQTVTFTGNDVTLESVFAVVKKQTGFLFLYPRSIVHSAKPVSVSANNVPLEQFLEEIFRAQPLEYSIKGKNIFVSPKDPQARDAGAGLNSLGKDGADSLEMYSPPPITVRGRIVNEQGEPVTASVMVKGQNIGTTSDVDGYFILANIDNNATLVFSSVGYASLEVRVNNRVEINITLSVNASGLSEIVMIGYGSRSKKDVTTSISTLKSERIEKQVPASPELLMQGQMSGVQVIGNPGNPSARPVVRIRGTNTWGVSDPLYVIDGIPVKEYGAGIEGTEGTNQFVRGYANIMATIDPNDIESISVLKDATAGAIYGVRAANGVVLITTKKGKKGAPAISISQRFGIQNVNKKMDLLNTQQYVAYNNALYATDPASAGARSALNYVFDPGDPRYLGNSPTYDWQSAIRNKNAETQDYSVNVSGGTDKMDYFASFGYMDQEGVNIHNFMKRYSGSLKLNVNVTDFLKVGLNYRLSTQQSNNFARSPIDISQTPPPWQPIYDPNGINGYAAAINGYDANGVWLGSAKYGNMTRYNYPGFLSLINFPISSVRNLGSAYVEVTPVKNLRIRGTVNVDRFDNSSRRFTRYATAYFMYDGANPASKGGAGSVGEYMRRSSLNLNIIKEITANYTRSFGRHSIDILFNAMDQKFSVDYLDGYTSYVPSNDFNLAALGGDNQYTTVTSFVRRGALQGTLLRVGYNFSSRYYLDLTVRRDGSSRFAPENRWGTFPAVSAAWRLTEEAFLKNTDWLDDLKFRAGWGQLGNQEVKDMAYVSQINTSPAYAWGNNQNNDGRGYLNSAATVYGMPNRELTWEKTSTINVGFDATLFRRLNISLEYYDKMTNGILQTLTLPPSVGLIEKPVGNVAKVQNRGIELTTSYSGEAGRFTYSFGGNFTTVRNRVITLYGGIPINNIEEGYPLFYISGFKLDGRFETDEEVADWLATHNDLRYRNASVRAGDFYFKDLRGAPGAGDKFYSNQPDGVVDDYDQVYLGKTIPGYFYGLNFNLGYAGFDLSANFIGVGDVQKVNSLKSSLVNLNNEGATHTTDALNYWTPTNRNTDLPRLIWQDPASNSRFSDFSVEDAGYLRLSNLQLGYTLPDIGIKNVLKSLRAYVGTSNLFTITNFSGFDPEDQNSPAPLVIYAGVNARF